MTYAHKVCRVTLSGTMWGGAEQWSTGFFLGEEGSDSQPPTQSDADEIAAAFRTFFISAGASISSSYDFTTVKCQSLEAVSGKPIVAETVYASVATPRIGAETTFNLPSQCSLVVSLLSDRPRGKASHGRMYLPGVGLRVEGTGRILASDRTAYVTGLTTFFQPMITAGDKTAGRLILAAKASGAGGLNPAQNDYVQSIRVGDIIDTQRRRRNGLSESYLTQIL